MQHQLLKVNGSTCMLVEIIAKNSQNSAWNISLDGEHISNANIRRVSIDQFYKIVTGQTNAFRDLCQQLPLVIEDVIDSLQEDMINNSVFEELEVLSPNILRSLYLLSFAKYEGFENFEI